MLLLNVVLLFLSVGLSNLKCLSFKRSNTINAEGMRAFSSLVNLEKLDLERCSEIRGGFIHLKGLSCFLFSLSLSVFFFWFLLFKCEFLNTSPSPKCELRVVVKFSHMDDIDFGLNVIVQV